MGKGAIIREGIDFHWEVRECLAGEMTFDLNLKNG